MSEAPLSLEEAEVGTVYYVEFGWTYEGKYRKPAYRAKILDKDVGKGLVRLSQEVMGPSGRGAVWQEVEHPAADLFIYPLPEALKVDSAP